MQAIVKSLGAPKKPIPAPVMEDMKGTTDNTAKCQGIIIMF